MIPPADRLALKTAFRLLVEGVGGVEAAAAVTGSSIGRLSEAYSPHTDRMPRLDHAAALERVSGKRYVTEVMARLCGAALVTQRAEAGDLGAALAAVMGAGGVLGADALEALGDGRLTEDERAKLRVGAGRLRAVLERAEAALAAGGA